MFTNPDNVPFGELGREDKAALLVAAHLYNRRIEFLRSDGLWGYAHTPNWHEHIAYRVTPNLPSIDWSHVAPKYKWLAFDNSGEAHLYTAKPTKSVSTWRSNAQYDSANSHASLKRGDCDWTESLIQRPEST